MLCGCSLAVYTYMHPFSLFSYTSICSSQARQKLSTFFLSKSHSRILAFVCASCHSRSHALICQNPAGYMCSYFVQSNYVNEFTQGSSQRSWRIPASACQRFLAFSAHFVLFSRLPLATRQAIRSSRACGAMMQQRPELGESKDQYSSRIRMNKIAPLLPAAAVFSQIMLPIQVRENECTIFGSGVVACYSLPSNISAENVIHRTCCLCSEKMFDCSALSYSCRCCLPADCDAPVDE